MPITGMGMFTEAPSPELLRSRCTPLSWKPSTVALAVPLYKNFAILKKHAWTVGVSVLSGAVLAYLSSAWLAKELKLNAQIMESIAPRSATTPIAMAISQLTGGVPAITALFVLMTGLLGMLIGPVIIRIFRIRNEIARGVLLGTSAHTAGTSKAFEFGYCFASAHDVHGADAIAFGQPDDHASQFGPGR